MLLEKIDNLRKEGRAVYEKAQRLEKMLPQIRRESYNSLKAKYPGIEQRDWAGLVRAMQAGKLPVDMSEEINVIYEEISTYKEQAAAARIRSKEIYAAAAAADTRRALDPEVDPTPRGQHQKLRQCTQYPQRKDCNDGESETEKWKRCKFMVYGESGFRCIAPTK
ncbi:hypothetical protein PSH97_16575 [Pseudomonas cucumis]|uniref:Uncharacterized protein n=1 Tax=Pseudomonas cucumis TaxID=2954082 RepID=A0ABY9EQ54_9PSED|nr:hypothetical protein [Pseudomonas cucumis]WLG82742.1 hypothetical protein PSH97_16575 [Pseudomonas cucumis]